MKQSQFEQDWVESILLVHTFFNDVAKTNLWLNTPNPNLGGATPVNTMVSGRGIKLLSWIKTSLDENKPDAQTFSEDKE